MPRCKAWSFDLSSVMVTRRSKRTSDRGPVSNDEHGGFQHYLWKSLLKKLVLMAQPSEIRGLLALCTRFVQTQFPPRSLTIYAISGIKLRFHWVFELRRRRSLKNAENLCKTRRESRQNKDYLHSFSRSLHRFADRPAREIPALPSKLCGVSILLPVR